jgi:transposase
LKNTREQMDVLAAYREVGSYRGAAELCGTTHKTVKRIVVRHLAGEASPQRQARGHNYDDVSELVAERVRKSAGRISAKRLLPDARAAGYTGSPRNFRRLLAGVKAERRRGHHRGRRPGVCAPGDTLVIDWGVQNGLHVFCAVSAWSRFRFVRFAADEKASRTLGLLAECFDALGGVPKTVLADRMGCLKAGVVANLVVPTADYVRFAMHYGFRPDFCHGHDPESKGIVEHLVGYAKRDLIVPQNITINDLAVGNALAAQWCAEVNAAVHSEICAVPAVIGRTGEHIGSRWRHLPPPDRSPSRSGGVEQLCAPKGEPVTQTVEVLADQAVLREVVGVEQLRLRERVGEHASIEGDVRVLGELQ